MSLSTKVESTAPKKFKEWWRQRIRWNIGGTQCILKYKKNFLKNGMLGYFILPFFSLSLFVGLFGLGLFIYLFIRRIILIYLETKYTIISEASIFHLEEFSFSPSVLNFFGVVLFILGFIFILFGLYNLKKIHQSEKQNIFNLLFFSLIYLTIYPVIVIFSLYKLIKGNYTW